MNILCFVVLVALSVVSVPSFAFVSSAIPLQTDEPDIRDVQEEVLRYARLSMAELDVLKRKEKLSALLPQVSFQFDHRVGERIDVDINDNTYVGSSGVVVGPQEAQASQYAEARQNYAVRLDWRLHELLFSRNRITISEESRARMREVRSLLGEATHLYFSRQKCLKEMTMLQHNKEKLALKTIELQEAEAGLDVLTNGWFRRKIHAH
ncbi:MAG: hypothetical protein HY540_00655 [Deltaproteobacteria bacterium]|nr:hypothetical protein [Deltaproteobacteria bacterium]